MAEKLKHCPFCDCWLPGAGGDGSRSHPQSKCILSSWIITPHDAKVWNARPVEDKLAAELTAERERSKKLKAALNDLLEQIDCLDGIEYTKDLEPYKAEAVWDDVLSRAQEVAKDSHDSDCAMHNEPAYPKGPCNCSLSKYPKGDDHV